MFPATSRKFRLWKELDAPAVATGTLSVTPIMTVPPPGTVITPPVRPPGAAMLTVCVRPAAFACAAVNFAAEEPLFCRAICFAWLKLPAISAKPKLSALESFSPTGRAMTWVFVDPIVCTRPVPPRLDLVCHDVGGRACVDDRRLDLVGRPRRVGLARKGCNARHVRRGHRGARKRRGTKPVPMPVETVLTPGAVISGLRKLSPVRGPLELKDAKVLKAVFVTVVGVRSPKRRSPRAACRRRTSRWWAGPSPR